MKTHKSIHSKVEINLGLLYLLFSMKVDVTSTVCQLQDLAHSEPVLVTVQNSFCISESLSRRVLLDSPEGLMKQDLLEHVINESMCWKELPNFLKYLWKL
jgi:hypothetical protein